MTIRPASRLRSLAVAMPGAPPPGISGDPGLFGPTSTAWYVGRERVLLAGGAAALLLQVAHPLVAAGVTAHSDFAGNPLLRLHTTLDATLTVTFGDLAQVEAAAAAVRRRHRAVRGTVATTTGSTAAGATYRADDPDLALWVFATLVWSAIAAHEQFVGHLPPQARNRYYDEIKNFGRLFGVTDDRFPRDYTDLARYVDEMIDTRLAVGAPARRLAAEILTPRVPLLPAGLREVPRVLAGALLPAAVREMYGLGWRRRDQAASTALRTISRLVLPALPARLRYWPHYLSAVKRVSQMAATAP